MTLIPGFLLPIENRCVIGEISVCAYDLFVKIRFVVVNVSSYFGVTFIYVTRLVS